MEIEHLKLLNHLESFTADELTQYLLNNYINTLTTTNNANTNTNTNTNETNINNNNSNTNTATSNKISISNIIDKLKKDGPRQICQAQFCKNDIVW